MPQRTSDYIGLEGTDADVELSIQRETDRAYLLLAEDGQTVWMPKEAFDGDGMLYKWAVPILEQKLAGEEED